MFNHVFNCSNINIVERASSQINSESWNYHDIPIEEGQSTAYLERIVAYVS